MRMCCFTQAFIRWLRGGFPEPGFPLAELSQPGIQSQNAQYFAQNIPPGAECMDRSASSWLSALCRPLGKMLDPCSTTRYSWKTPEGPGRPRNRRQRQSGTCSDVRPRGGLLILSYGLAIAGGQQGGMSTSTKMRRMGRMCRIGKRGRMRRMGRRGRRARMCRRGKWGRMRRMGRRGRRCRMGTRGRMLILATAGDAPYFCRPWRQRLRT